VLLSSGDSFPHLIQKRRSQIGFVTYLLNYLRIIPQSNIWTFEAVFSFRGLPPKRSMHFSAFSKHSTCPAH